MNDLCPGTPNPCVVSGQFNATPGTTFDLGGRALTVSAGAKISATAGGFSLVNAASIDLLAGSTLSAVPGALPDIALQASGACTLGGKIFLNAAPSAGAGGTLQVTCAGVSLGGGSLIAAKGSAGGGGSVSLDAGTGAFSSDTLAKIDLRGSGADGGSLDVLAASSCALTKTTIRLEGLPNAAAESGGAGGSLSMTCNGISLSAGTAILANGSVLLGEGGPGGAVVLAGGTGGVSMALGSRIQAKTRAEGGGQLTVTGDGACDLGGLVDVAGTAVVVTVDGEAEIFGGAGGFVSIDCGSVSIGSKAKLTVSTSKIVEAGTIEIQSAGDVAIAEKARLRFDGEEADTAVIVGAEGACTVDGTLTGGAREIGSPSISFTCSSFNLGQKGSLLTTSFGEAAGSIQIDTTGQDIGEPGTSSIAGRIVARGVSIVVFGEVAPGSGGTIELACGIDANVAGTGLLDASGAGTESGGGSVTITADGNSLIDGRLWANGKDSGGETSVDACQVNVSASGQMRAKGVTGGSNDLVAHDSLTVAGSLSAVTDGSNSLRFLNTQSVTGSIAPSAAAVQDGLLPECVMLGP